jgi:hypothetical protein
MIATVCKSAWRYSYWMPVPLEDVAEVIAEDVVKGEMREEEIVGLFKLKDGRFLYVTGGCDTSGWECQAHASGEIRDTLLALVRECCTDDDRRRLKIEFEQGFVLIAGRVIA